MLNGTVPAQREGLLDVENGASKLVNENHQSASENHQSEDFRFAYPRTWTPSAKWPVSAARDQKFVPKKFFPHIA
jgi:hypothetical protein